MNKMGLKMGRQNYEEGKQQKKIRKQCNKKRNEGSVE
jgi:hypothetical protein